MTILGISTADSIKQLIVLVVDLQFLELLGDATTVKYRCLDDLADVLVMQKHVHRRPI